MTIDTPTSRGPKGAPKRAHVVVEGNVNDVIGASHTNPTPTESNETQQPHVEHYTADNDAELKRRDRSRTPERQAHNSETMVGMCGRGTDARKAGDGAMLRSPIPRGKKKMGGAGGRPPDQ